MIPWQVSDFCFYFVAIVEELLKSHRLNGTLIGQKEKGTYHPENYVKTQNKWVEDFYNQNYYLGEFIFFFIIILYYYFIHFWINKIKYNDVIFVCLYDTIMMN